MAQHNANQAVDTTYTKIYVAGLPWRTNKYGLRRFFQQFGEIVHVNVVYDNVTRRSQGYGFVTFRDASSAWRACQNPYPIIEERQATCNLAYLGARRVNYNQTGQPLAMYVVMPYETRNPYAQEQQFYFPVYPFYPFPYMGPYGPY